MHKNWSKAKATIDSRLPRFEPRTLVDLSGQVASHHRLTELKVLEIPVQKSLLRKITRDHVKWAYDALDQDQLVQGSINIRQLLTSDNSNLPLRFDHWAQFRKERILRQLSLEEGWIQEIWIDKTDPRGLGFAIRVLHGCLPYVESLMRHWRRHWQQMKNTRPEHWKSLLRRLATSESAFYLTYYFTEWDDDY